MGPKSRGGVVTVLGGATGPWACCASAIRDPSATAPALLAAAMSAPRRDSAPPLAAGVPSPSRWPGPPGAVP